jgi:signal transduction histidine kinase
VLSKIFEPFFTTGKHRGTGLGLAICRNIIEAHGGEIHVESQQHMGTTISVWLPCVCQAQLSTV